MHACMHVCAVCACMHVCVVCGWVNYGQTEKGNKRPRQYNTRTHDNVITMSYKNNTHN